MDAVTTEIAGVAAGDELPTLTTTVSRTQMFLFSAASNNAHRIHYDRTWAVDVEGLKDVLVHGPFQGALMARLVTDWMGPDARLTGISVRHLRSAFPGDRLTFRGRVVGTRQEDGKLHADIEINEENDEGQILGTGKASVALPVSGVTR